MIVTKYNDNNHYIKGSIGLLKLSKHRYNWRFDRNDSLCSLNYIRFRKNYIQCTLYRQTILLVDASYSKVNKCVYKFRSNLIMLDQQRQRQKCNVFFFIKCRVSLRNRYVISNRSWRCKIRYCGTIKLNR